MDLPVDYVIQKLYQYAGTPKYNKQSNNYLASCPICKEGQSWLKRKRLYYFLDKNYFYCHNCGQSYSALSWIKKVSGMSNTEIYNEIKNNNYNIIPDNEKIVKEQKKIPSLPHDSINLSDSQQLEFYKNEKIVNDCIEFTKNRYIDIAINRPKNFYISLTDYIHKNRLCIPFYDFNDKIIFYQTRAIYKKDEENYPKYMSKLNGNKSVYGINNINTNIEYLFIFEGPIDAMSTINGVSIGGLNLTTFQEQQLEKFKTYKKIWVLDNEFNKNKEVKQKYLELIDKNETTFIWPKQFDQFKDFNEICVHQKRYDIPHNFIIKNSYSGIKALSLIKL